MDDHKINGVCDCNYCLMITIMYGDPELNNWEKEFVESVSDYACRSEYTDKQKSKIEQIFNKQRKLYMEMDCP